MLEILEPAIFESIGAKMLRRQAPILERIFAESFGVVPTTCATIWNASFEKPPGLSPKHLMWALLFLKVYASEHVHCSMACVDEKTFRKWCWKAIDFIASLNVVCNFTKYDTVPSLLFVR